MTLNPRLVQLFLTVCRVKSISGAARSENLSQPSVSVSMRQLERTIGAKLFDRRRSGIELTQAGEALERRAIAIENLLEAARDEVQLVDVQVAGLLTVAGTPGALATLAPQIVAALSRKHPRFELRIIEATDVELPELLRNLRVDIAIATTGVEERPVDIEEVSIQSDAFDLIVGRENEKLPCTIALDELSEARWILPAAGGAFKRQIDALFIGARTPMPRNVIRCDSLLTTKAIVQHTDYITILPRDVALTEVSMGALRAIQIRRARFSREVGLLWLAGRQLPPLAQLFLDEARRLKP